MLFYLTFIQDPQTRIEFEKVYNDYKSACLNEAMKYTGGDKLLAEDALHNVVVRIIEKHPEYLEESCSKLKASFVLIVRNEAIDLKRKEKIRSHESLEDNEEETALIEDIPLHSLFEGSETYTQILKCLENLNDLYKVVFLHRYLYDMKYKEIAEVLGITEKSVSVRLYRAKLQLRELLNKEGIENV